MSAFIVCKEHLDYLVGAGLARRGNYGPLRWICEEPPATAETHERGEPWGPEAVDVYAKLRRVLTRETADRVGQVLAAENRRSVDHRYDENEVEDLYHFEESKVPFDPVQVLKAIDCYEYQSCEHPGWKDSEARRFCDSLRGDMIGHLPGYDVALWEVDSSEHARKLAEEKKKVLERQARAAALKAIDGMDRNAVMKAIKTALEKRSGKKWSVTGGKGTAWGWLRIDAPPARRTWKNVDTGRKDADGKEIWEEVNDPSKDFGHTGPDDRAELGRLLGKDKPVHCQGESVPSGSDFWAEYLQRAEGKTPTVYGVANWD